MKRLLLKRHLCLKLKRSKRRFKIVKDKAINNFLLQHLTPVKLDFFRVQNCLLNQLAKGENAINKLFPELNEAKNETNLQLFNNLSDFKCNNSEEKW